MGADVASSDRGGRNAYLAVLKLETLNAVAVHRWFPTQTTTAQIASELDEIREVPGQLQLFGLSPNFHRLASSFGGQSAGAHERR